MAKRNKLPAAVTAMTPDRVRGVQERRFGGGYGAHDSRQRGTRTRAGARSAAIRDSRG